MCCGTCGMKTDIGNFIFGVFFVMRSTRRTPKTKYDIGINYLSYKIS